MNEEIKRRYQELKNRSREHIKEKNRESNILLQECLSVLGNSKMILAPEQEREILDKFNSKLPSIMNSNIKKNVLTIQEMFPQWISKQVYIIWDKEGLPIIQTDFECVIKYIDEVLAVSFETWVVAEDMNQFIQFDDANRIIEIFLKDN